MPHGERESREDGPLTPLLKPFQVLRRADDIAHDVIGGIAAAELLEIEEPAERTVREKKVAVVEVTVYDTQSFGTISRLVPRQLALDKPPKPTAEGAPTLSERNLAPFRDRIGPSGKRRSPAHQVRQMTL